MHTLQVITIKAASINENCSHFRPLSSSDTTSKQTLCIFPFPCIGVLTTQKGRKSHEWKQHIFFQSIFYYFHSISRQRGYKNNASFTVKLPSALSISNPLSLPLSLRLTVSLSFRSLLKCEMDLSWSLSTWFPREPRESSESDFAVKMVLASVQYSGD